MTKPVRTQLRLSAELHERVRKRAYIRKASLNKTMNELMEKRLDEEEAEERAGVEKQQAV